MLANGELRLSLGYSGDFVQAARRAREAKKGVELNYPVAPEGSLFDFNFLAIPQDARHLVNA